MFGGSALAAGFLGLVGVMLASRSTNAIFDPIAGTKALMPHWVFVVWIIAAIGGSISNNALTLYSAGLAAQAMGLPLKRWQATLVDGALAIAGLVYVLIIDDAGTFLAKLNSYIVLSIAWVGPFGAIWLVDLWWRKWYVRPHEAHGGSASPFSGFKGSRVAAWVALTAGVGTALLTIGTPAATGWIARHLLEGTDTSWATGPIVALAIYVPWAYRAVKSETAELAAANGD